LGLKPYSISFLCQIRYNKEMEDKPINWVGGSREDVGAFPEEARRKAGLQLRAVQRGEAPVDFKSMSIVGKGVQEIRIRTEEAHRIFYVARFDEAVYVLHAFQKKTQKATKQDIEIGQQRYQQMMEYRESQKQRDSKNE
jgi:phage-related protein